MVALNRPLDRNEKTRELFDPTRRRVNFEMGEERVLLDAAPAAAVAAPDEGFVNEDVAVTVTFDNADAADTGYGPYADVLADGPLGLSIAGGSAELVGTWDATDNRFEDLAGDEVAEHPLTGRPLATDADLIAGRADGDQFYAVTLPYGSFVADQPTADIDITATLSKAGGATPGTPLTIQARGGFMFGGDALNNPDADPPIVGTFDAAQITPIVVALSKEAIYAEDEPPTGDGWPVTYRVVVDVADGETIGNLVVDDLLPPEMAFEAGSQNRGTIDGQTIRVTAGDLVGTAAGDDLVLEYRAHVLDVIPDDDGNFNDDLNLAAPGTITYAYGGVAGLTASASDAVTAKLLSVQKSVTNVTDSSANGNSAGDTLEWLDDVQVSDHTDAAGLVLDTRFGDGQAWVDGFAPTYSLSQDGPSRGGTFDARNYARAVNTAGGGDGSDDGLTDARFYLSDQLVDDALGVAPALHYRFDGGFAGPWADASGNGLHATPGNVTASADTNRGHGSARFDRTGGLVAPDPALGDAITIAAWYRPDNAQNRHVIATNTGSDGGPDGFDGFRLDVKDGTLRLKTGAASVNSTIISTPGIIQSGRWQHVAVTFDAAAGTARLFVDGADVTGGGSATAGFDAGGPLTLGATSDGDLQLAGNVSDFRAYAGAVDVAALFAAGTAAGDGPTSAQVRYRTEILDRYRDTFPSGDPSVDSGDAIAASAAVLAQLGGPAGDVERDGSAAGVRIVGPTFSKTIHAIDGDVNYADAALRPGQTVTYRLRGTFPTGDVERLRFTDYLPLPVLDADDPDADGVTSGWTFVAGGGLPNAGEVRFGPLHNLDDPDVTWGDDSPNALAAGSTLTWSGPSNTLAMDFGTFDVARSSTVQTLEVDVLLTVAATDRPFADGLYLTNQAQFEYGDTSTAEVADSELVQVRLDMPELTLTKGVSAINGNADARVTGTDGDANALDVDAGDVVTFRVEVTNAGGGGAFDLALFDAIPAGFEQPAGGFNYRVTDAAGGVRADFAGTLLGGDFELADAGGDAGLPSGEKLVIEYDLRVRDDAHAAATYGRGTEAVITRYGANDGGNDFTAGNAGPWQDDATATVLRPGVSVALTDTDRPHTIGNDVAVGEVLTYTATITLPEGVTTDLDLRDALPKGMAFVDVVSVAGGNDVSFSPGTPQITSRGGGGNNGANLDRALVQPLGTVTTTDNGTGVSGDTITIVYRAAITNTTEAGNAVYRQNQANIAWQGDAPGTGEAAGPLLRVHEPRLTLTTTADRTNADAGDVVTFTVLARHADSGDDSIDSDADAFDLAIAEAVPAGMTFVPGSLAATAGSVAFDSLSESGGAISATVASLALDSQLAEFTFQATVDGDVTPGIPFTTDGLMTWTSLPGDATVSVAPSNPHAVERTGDPATPAQTPADNDHRAASAVTVGFVAPTAVTTLVVTSEPSTAGTDVAVGEVVRYALDLTVPESTMPDARLVATLPAGLEIIDLAQVKLTLVGDFTTEPDLTDAADTLDPSRITDHGDGTITFDLGDLVNNDRDAGDESLRLAFNALVLNAADNNAGDAKQALFDFGVNGNALVTSDPAALAIVEPQIDDVDKRLLNAPRDAGDAAEFRVTFTNTGDATAHDVRLVDPLGEHLALDPAGVTVAGTNGATGTAAVAPDGVLTVVMAAVRPGETVTINYAPTLRESARPGQPLASTARVDYTSLAGNGGDSANPTGTAAGPERDGSGGVDDYADADADGFTTATPTFGHELLATGLADAGVLTPLDELAVGETATFRLTATLTEGTTPRLVLSEQLPVLDAGVLEVVSANVVAGFGGNLSGGYDATPAPLPEDTDGDGRADRVTLYFGADVVNAADNQTTDADRVVIDVVARLADVPENVPADREGITREFFAQLPGPALDDLVAAPAYPDEPTSRDVLVRFEATDPDDPSDTSKFGDDYGQRVRGYLVPPTTGEYMLFLASDGNGSLRLSTDADPANAAEVASVPDFTNPRQWDKFAQQRSAPVTLEAGRRYYVEVLHKEERGGDNLAVGWLTPGAADDVANVQVVPGSALRPLFVPLDAQATFDYGPVTLAESASIETVEPVLVLGQQASRAQADAGDTLAFAVDVTHAAESHADAYDLALIDLLDGPISLVAGSVVVEIDGVAQPAGVVTTGNAPGDTAVRVDLDALPLGGTLTVTYDAVVTDAVRPGDRFGGDARLAYDSHPDPTLGRAGAAQADALADAAAVPTLAADFATSLAQTAGGGVAVGEEITLTLAADLPEGTLDRLVLSEALPDGLAIVGTRVVSAGGLTNAALAAGDAGSVAGNAVTFDFGNNVTNPGDNDSANDRVVVEIVARVADAAGNTNGTALAAAAGLDYGSGWAAHADDFAVVEPALAVAQSRTPGTGDAGDEIEFTVVVDHAAASASDAFLATLTDALSPNLRLIAGSVTTTAGTVTLGNAAGDETIAVDLGTVAADGTAVIRYRAALADAVTPGDAPGTDVELAWHSAPADGRAYAAITSTAVNVVGATTINGTGANSSLAETGHARHTAAYADLTIGERYTVKRRLTLPEGTVPDLVATIDLPEGRVELEDVRVTRVGGNVTTATQTVTRHDDDGDGLNDRAVLGFGRTINAGDNADSAADQIDFEFRYRVLNVPANADGTTLAADVRFDDGLKGGTANSVTDVVTPDLAVTQTRTPASGDAGDVVSYEVVVANNGTGPAYLAGLTDDLPAGLRLDVGSVTTTAGTVTLGNAAGDEDVAIDFGTLAAGHAATVTYRAVLADTVTPGDAPATDVNLVWASAPADGRPGTAAAATSVAVTGGTSLARVSGGTSLAETIGSDLAIGETFTLSHAVTLPEGTVPDLRVVVDVPAGLAELLAADVAAVGGRLDAAAVAPTLVDADGDGQADRAVFDFGQVTNAGDNVADDGDRILLTFTGRALDVPAAAAGQELAAAVTVADGLTTQTDSANYTLVEPALTVAQARTPGSGDAGDEVEFTVVVDHAAAGTQAAFAAAVVDELDPALGLVVGSVSTTRGVVTAGNAAGDAAVAVDVGTLAAADGPVVIRYRATLRDAVTPGDELAARARLTWASAPTDGRAYAADSGTAVTATGATTVTTAVTTDRPETTAAEHDSAAEDLAIGERVTFTDTVTLPEGTLPRLVLTRDLPKTPGGDPLIIESAGIVTPAGTLDAMPQLTDADGDGVTDRVTFDFGTGVVVPGNNDAADNVMTLETIVRLADAPDAADGLALGTALAVDDGLAVAETAAVFDVVEPRLTIAKTADRASADIGEVVTFTLVVTHNSASTADAVDAVVTDALTGGGDADKFDLVEGSARVLAGPGTVTLGDDAGETTLAVSLADFARGDTAVITYQARANGFASALGDALSNDAVVTHLSAATGGRAYAAAHAGAPLATNPTGIAAVTAVVAGGDLAATAGADTAVGETVTIDATATLPNGRYPDDVILALDVPPGLRLVGGELAGVGANIHADAAPPVLDGTSISLTLWNVQVDTGGVPGDIRATFRVFAVVEDSPDVRSGSALTAGVRLDNGAASLTDSITLAVVEPSVTLTKRVGDPTPHLGDTVTFTLTADAAAGTADAYGLTIADALPAGLTLVPGSVTTTAGTVVGDGGVAVLVPQLAPGDVPVVVTYDAIVTSEPSAWAGDLSSTADAAYATHVDAAVARKLATSAATAVRVVGADLSVAAEPAGSTRAAGERWTQVLTVRNLNHPAADAAESIVVTAALPAGTEFVASDSPHFAEAAGRSVRFVVPALDVGGTVDLPVTLRALRPAPVGVDALTLSADVRHGDVEPTPADNAAAATVALDAAPALAVTSDVGVSAAGNGDVLTYTFAVTNLGDQPATGVRLAAELPPEVLDLVGGDVALDVPQLDVGETRTITFRAAVRDRVPAGAHDFVVTATARDDGTNGGVGVAEAASPPVTLLAEPDLQTTVAFERGDVAGNIAAATEANPRDPFRYTVVVRNAGGQDATGVVVTHRVDAGALDVTDAAGGAYDAATGTVTWTIDALPAGERVELHVGGVVRFPPPAGVRAFAAAAAARDDAANGPDANPADNAAGVSTKLAAFVFDTTANFAGRGNAAPGGASAAAAVPAAVAARGGGVPAGDLTFRRRPLPISSEPLYTGSAAPGSSVTIELFDTTGRGVGSRTVTADAAGQWLAAMPADTYVAEPANRAGRSIDGSRLFQGDRPTFGHAVSPLGFAPAAQRAAVGSDLGDSAHVAATTQSAAAAHLLGGGEDRTYFTSALHRGLSVRRTFDLGALSPDLGGEQDQLADPLQMGQLR